MRVVVIGPGLMGSQIGCEYALGGHDVVFVARRPEAAWERVERALAVVDELALYPDGAATAARRRIDITTNMVDIKGGTDLAVESVVEQLDAKVEILGRAARLMPEAILASNTSSLSITAIGEAIDAPDRVLGTHYWNPPLLMPLVEVIRGEGTDPAVVERVTATLRALGKRPVFVERDVPGFLWNRLQLALLREAIWLVEHGVATPATVDEVVRDGLARRWRFTGPFQTAALGGPDTFERIAANLWPNLSCADRLTNLRQWLDESPASLERVRDNRDRGLLGELRRERSSSDSAAPAAAPRADEATRW